MRKQPSIYTAATQPNINTKGLSIKQINERATRWLKERENENPRWIRIRNGKSKV